MTTDPSGYSGDKIHTGDLGLIRLDFLSGFDVLLIGLYRCRGCVGRFVCHKLDFCLANHNLGRVYWTYRKAPTRSDYGRFWDCLLGFLEPETATRYPDPALQVDLDLSHVSFVATANSLDPLPSPLRDRFRVVATFPEPGPGDLDALLPAITRDLAKENGLEARWVEPLTGFERDAIAAHWHGGSVRRLRRVVEALLRVREKMAPRN